MGFIKQQPTPGSNVISKLSAGDRQLADKIEADFHSLFLESHRTQLRARAGVLFTCLQLAQPTSVKSYTPITFGVVPCMSWRIGLSLDDNAVNNEIMTTGINLKGLKQSFSGIFLLLKLSPKLWSGICVQL